jgi:hypothetical protein
VAAPAPTKGRRQERKMTSLEKKQNRKNTLHQEKADPVTPLNMLFDYFINGLYMRVLKLTLGKIFFL